MNHTESHPLKDKTVRIKSHVKHPQVPGFGGAEFRVEDWWDKVAGRSWMSCDGNPACLIYAMRTGFSEVHVPIDDEVVYGKVGPFGHLLHVSEIESPAAETGPRVTTCATIYEDSGT